MQKQGQAWILWDSKSFSIPSHIKIPFLVQMCMHAHPLSWRKKGTFFCIPSNPIDSSNSKRRILLHSPPQFFLYIFSSSHKVEYCPQRPQRPPEAPVGSSWCKTYWAGLVNSGPSIGLWAKMLHRFYSGWWPCAKGALWGLATNPTEKVAGRDTGKEHTTTLSRVTSFEVHWLQLTWRV